jgi:hypothetical protein
MLLKELHQINEASSAGRAWEGRLKKVDALMSWMYDKGILTAGEKAKKDTIFRAYYRYYNDGDFPKALAIKGLSGKWGDRKENEKALEDYLESFIKPILAKYLPRVDRKEFRLDKMIEGLNTVIDVAKHQDAHGLLTYWLKKVKVNDEKLVALVDKLEEENNNLVSELNRVDPNNKNKVTSYRRNLMMSAKTWTPEFETQWKDMTQTIGDIEQFLINLRNGITRLKNQHIGSFGEE